jgi:hypothetical protein
MRFEVTTSHSMKGCDMKLPRIFHFPAVIKRSRTYCPLFSCAATFSFASARYVEWHAGRVDETGDNETKY